MTLRRLLTAATARMELSWNQTAHIMAAAFWSQGHAARVDDFNPLAKRSPHRESGPVDLPFPAKTHRKIDKSRIRVATE